MSRSSASGQQDHLGPGHSPPGAADLLVVGDRRLRRAQVHHEAQVGLVETHAQGAGGHERLELPVEQGALGGQPLLLLVTSGVGGDIVAPVAQEGRGLVGRGHGQGVDDAGPRQLVQVLGQPAEPLLRGGQLHHAQAQALPVQRAAQHQRLAVGPAGQLLGHVPGDPRVGRRRGGEHRHTGRQVFQHGAEPPVIRPEVMPPVGDAVRLVHDQHARGGGELGQDEVAEARVVQPLRADQQQVHGACGDLRVDLVPVRHVGRVHGPGLQPGPGRRLDLVAHQREQRGDDDGRPHVPGPEQCGRDEVHGRLAPAGALHDQGPAPVAGQRLDRGPLILAELGGRPGQRAQAASPPPHAGRARKPADRSRKP